MCLVRVSLVTAWTLFMCLARLSGGIPDYWWRLTGANTLMLWDTALLSYCVSLSSLSHTALCCLYPSDSWGNPPQEEKSRKVRWFEKFLKAGIAAQNQCSYKKTKRKVRNRCRSTQLKSSAFVFCLSYYLVSQLFWRISICHTAFVEGFMCPPTHFSHAPRPRPFPASFSLISLPDKFSHPVIVPSQQPLLWVCLFGVGLICDYGACHASSDSKREEEEKNSL